MSRYLAHFIFEGGAADTAPAELASGTGSAYGATPHVLVNAGLASGSGSALDATVSTEVETNVQAELASGTGAALGPYASIAPNSAQGAGSGAAGAPTASLASNAGAGAGSGAAGGSSSLVAVNPNAATGTGSAYDATVSTSADVDVNAGLASGTGEALGPTPYVAPNAGLASGTGAAHATRPHVKPNAGLASGTGVANGATGVTNYLRTVTDNVALGGTGTDAFTRSVGSGWGSGVFGAWTNLIATTTFVDGTQAKSIGVDQMEMEAVVPTAYTNAGLWTITTRFLAPDSGDHILGIEVYGNTDFDPFFAVYLEENATADDILYLWSQEEGFVGELTVPFSRAEWGILKWEMDRVNGIQRGKVWNDGDPEPNWQAEWQEASAIFPATDRFAIFRDSSANTTVAWDYVTFVAERDVIERSQVLTREISEELDTDESILPYAVTDTVEADQPREVQVLITVGGVDVTDDVDYRRSRFNTASNGQAGTAEIWVRDLEHTHAFETGAEVIVRFRGIRKWGGYVSDIRRQYVFPQGTGQDEQPRWLLLDAVDYNVLFNKRIYYRADHETNMKVRTWHNGTWDSSVISHLVNYYLDLGGDGLSYDIQHVGTPAMSSHESCNPDAPDRFQIGSAGWTWGEVMNTICLETNAVYYIDPDKVFRYVDDSTKQSRFGYDGLSDTPDDVNTIGYREVEFTSDGTRLINDMLQWGAGQGSDNMVFARVQDEESIALHGRWQAAELRYDIYCQESIELRANTWVYGSPQNHRGGKNNRFFGRVTVREPYFRVADVLELESTEFDFNLTLPVRGSEMTFPTPFDITEVLTLSQALDAPWSTYEFWIPTFDFNVQPFEGLPPPVLPVLPGPELPPLPTVFNPCECVEGFDNCVDNFNRTVSGTWGTGDWGYVWNKYSGTSTINVDGDVGEITTDGFDVRMLTAGLGLELPAEILVKWRFVGSGTERYMEIGIGDPDTSGDVNTLSYSENTTFTGTVILTHNDDSDTYILPAGWGATDGRWMWSRYRMLSATQSAGRIWPDGEEEPTFWQTQVTGDFLGPEYEITIFADNHNALEVDGVAIVEGKDCTCITYEGELLGLPGFAGVVDDFDRTVASGWGTGAFGAWGPGTVDGSVDGDKGLIDDFEAIVAYPLGTGEIEMLMQFKVVPTSGNGWSIGLAIEDASFDRAAIEISGFSAAQVAVNAQDDRASFGVDSAQDPTGIDLPPQNQLYWGRMLVDEFGTFGRFWADGDTEPVMTSPLTPNFGGRDETWHCYDESTTGPRTGTDFGSIHFIAQNNNGHIELYSLELLSGEPCSGELALTGDAAGTGGTATGEEATEDTDPVTPVDPGETVFVVADQFMRGSTQVWVDGIRIRLGLDYLEYPRSRRIKILAHIDTTGATVLVDYVVWTVNDPAPETLE